MKQVMREALEDLEAGNWEAAHDAAQKDPSPEAAWLHAHLHRVEGDRGNANYWYARAGRDPFDGSEAEEREALRAALSA